MGLEHEYPHGHWFLLSFDHLQSLGQSYTQLPSNVQHSVRGSYDVLPKQTKQDRWASPSKEHSTASAGQVSIQRTFYTKCRPMLLGSSVTLWVNLIFRVHQSRQRLVWSSRVVLKWYYHRTASLVCDCHLFITRKGKMVFEPLFSATRRTQNALLGFTSAARYM